MVTKGVRIDRDKMIRDIHRAFPYWSYAAIAELVGVSKQRVHQILKEVDDCDTIPIMMNSVIREPISATQAAKITGISYGTIAMWVSRGLVDIFKRPRTKKACTNNAVLLDPVSLNKRIVKFHERVNKAKNKN